MSLALLHDFSLLQLLALEQLFSEEHDLPLLHDFAPSSFLPNHFFRMPMVSISRAPGLAERSDAAERCPGEA